MRALVLLLALALPLTLVGTAGAVADTSTCPLHLVCETLADVKCILQDPTNNYRTMSYCLGWIP